MESQTRSCQNCKTNFVIEPDDFSFCEKMKVPAPTWCPGCQLMRRLSFRNERTIYKRKESDSEKDIISVISVDKPMTVYSHNRWWSDSWDPMEYGQDYDFLKSFFSQISELMKRVPHVDLFNYNSVNSDYGNFTTDNKNCYLVFGGDFNEDCSYSTFNFYSKNVYDTYFVHRLELCYENTDTENNHKVFFAQYTRDSADSSFIYNGVNLNNCLGCVNLHNKSYCIFNEQYTKEEYLKKILEFDLGSYSRLQEFKKKFYEFKLQFPHRYAYIIKSSGSTGDNIKNVKNAINCFDVSGEAENLKNVFLAGWGLRDALNIDHAGHKSELLYDTHATFSNCSKVKYSVLISISHDIIYSYNCHSSNNLFGCVGLRNKQYCILNKQYTKEEYEALVPKIIEHMNDMPYVDKKGRVYKYGEFFPPEISLFAYNETIAQEYFPLTKEKAIEQGYKWKDPEEKNYKIDIRSEDLPDDIKNVEESISGKIIECAHRGKCDEQCVTAFKIIPSELQFYKRMNLPLPRLCPNCRHYQRFRQRNPIKLWHRSCMKTGCTNEFETSYAPERPEIIYCEKCYQQEVC